MILKGKIRARKRGQRIYMVDSRGRVRGSFRTNKRGAMTRGAARRRFNRFGTKRSRRRDRRRTARNTYHLRSNRRNRRGQAKWFIRPNEYDIKGIDTKMGKKRSGRKRSRSRAYGRKRSRSM